MNKIMKSLILGLSFVIAITFFALTLKGDSDPTYFQTKKDSRVTSPFESTGSNSRYALTEAIIKYNTVFFNDELARFASPDIVRYNGKYSTLFTPGVSFLGLPLFVIGDSIGFPQLSTFLLNVVFAVLNFILVGRIARKLGAGYIASILSGFLFIFGTNAFSYAHTFTQHESSATLLLLALLNCIGKRTLFKNIWLGILLGIGILVDIPNAFMMAPLLIYAGLKNFSVEKVAEKTKLSLKLSVVGFIIGVLPFIALFGWYNQLATGSPTKLAQLIGRIDYQAGDVNRSDAQVGINESKRDPYAQILPYNTRDQVNGFFILLVSNERGWWYYSPMLAIGILGLYQAYKNTKTRTLAILAGSVIGIDILSYAMFGDPWGGWSFGPRYLIPASAMACTGIGVAVSHFQKNKIFTFIFMILVTLSLAISLLGALTTNSVPPRVESVAMPDPIPYTYEYNIELLNKNMSSALVFNAYAASFMDARYYFIYLFVGISAAVLILYVLSYWDKREEV